MLSKRSREEQHTAPEDVVAPDVVSHPRKKKVKGVEDTEEKGAKVKEVVLVGIVKTVQGLTYKDGKPLLDADTFKGKGPYCSSGAAVVT